MPGAGGTTKSLWASAERRPHFFKVLVGDFKQRLKIPPNFCKHIPWEESSKAKSLKEASMAATLEGPSGRTWLVVIHRTTEGTFFTSGWPKFVQDQALRDLEFVVFRYDGNTHFTAMVFDRTACEREDLIGGGGDRPRKKRGRRPRDASRDTPRPKKDSVGKELVTYRASPSGQQLQILDSNWTTEPGSAAVKNEEDAEEPPLRALPAAPAQRASPRRVPEGALDVDGAAARRGSVKTRSLQDDLALASIPPSIQRYKGYVSRRRPVTTAERQRATEIAHAFRSPLPYCVIRMSTMHVYYSFMMRFPTGFSRQHLPRERTDVVLRDPGGKAWVVLYIPNTRDRLSRGWCAFARGNCLEEGDYCVFELVAAAEFRVHIFRVVEPAVPAVRLRRVTVTCSRGTT
ncbi:B3 domain-containing protein Os01g0723500 [Oryza brachyantha]|uniref:TF-B3 domain-containing protein n=1 Tax=Oryza brachyantha TaxID=4533 RepID=J3L3M4_ORYBR|nr:B3 domain-containing protein Os01g0723500 [Oryza brachyantha]